MTKTNHIGRKPTRTADQHFKLSREYERLAHTGLQIASLYLNACNNDLGIVKQAERLMDDAEQNGTLALKHYKLANKLLS